VAAKDKNCKNLTEDEKTAMVENTIGVRKVSTPRCLLKLQDHWRCALHQPMFCYREYDSAGQETVHKTINQKTAITFKLTFIVVRKQKSPPNLEEVLAKTARAKMDMESNDTAKKRKDSTVRQVTAQPAANNPVVNINLSDSIPQLFTSLGNPRGNVSQQLPRVNNAPAANVPHQYLPISVNQEVHS
jgi:hypothetical protein